MENFFSLVESRVDECSSLLCVGLDPHTDDLESPTAASALAFCLRIIKATAPSAAAFKPNAALFEAFGAEGWTTLARVIEAVRDESERRGGARIPVILDAKRGDIASSAEGYARSAFGNLRADAITLNPYLGRDSVEPFIQDPAKGVFLLCKTSNPGARDVQDLLVGGDDESSSVPGAKLPLHVHVAKLAQSWSTHNNIGLVVGATHSESLARVRAAAPDLWFLVPGVGAQGGDLESALGAGLWKDGKGMLINVSRGISRAADPGRAAADLRDSMLSIRASATKHTKTVGDNPSQRPEDAAQHFTLADALLSAGCIKFGEFTLKSGLKSPIYIDLRQIISSPTLLEQIGRAYLPILRSLHFECLAALPYAAIPIATAISLQGNYPMIYPRKEAKAYGTKAEIEGEYQRGETVVVIDDLATTGGSKFEAIDKLTSAGLTVKDVVVLVDRQSGARESLAQAGYTLHGVLTISEMLDHWEKTGKVDRDKIEATRKFLMQSRT